MDKRSLLIFASGAVLATALTTSIFIFQVIPTQPAQIPNQSQSSQTLQKFKLSCGNPNNPNIFLLTDTAKERGIWTSNGLEPECISITGQTVTDADIKEHVAQGIKIGIGAVTSEVPLARSKGIPVKIVAGYHGVSVNWIFVRADSPMKTIKDLDGKKVGIQTINDFTYRNVVRTSNKYGIQTEIVPLGNYTNQVVALKLGRIDAFDSSATPVLRLVDSGELRILHDLSVDAPTPTSLSWSGPRTI